MKINRLYLMIIGTLVFSSCAKESSQTEVKKGMALVSGSIKCNLDYTNDTSEYGYLDTVRKTWVTVNETTYDSVPAGTVINFYIPGKELQEHPVDGYDYTDVHIQSTISEDGSYTVSLPCVNKNINVLVTFEEFEADHTFAEIKGWTKLKTTKKAVYYCNSTSLSIKNGDRIYKDFTYIKR